MHICSADPGINVEQICADLSAFKVSTPVYPPSPTFRIKTTADPLFHYINYTIHSSMPRLQIRFLRERYLRKLTFSLPSDQHVNINLRESKKRSGFAAE